MILIGNQRGGARDLAQHLLKEENDHVHVHDVRGFMSSDLDEALTEAYAVSRGTRCKQFLFSLSLNPPKDAQVSTEAFESAINRVETKLGLEGQPRAIVFHEKEGRRHAHAVWSRIKVEEMKAVQMSYSGEKLMDVSRELHREHGWKMPKGLVERSERDPRNFTLEEWQQAKRNGVDPRAIKTHIQDAWTVSDSKASLRHALEARGYRLARGDRRGFVAVDYRGEVYSIPKFAAVKTKDVRKRLGDPSDLLSVEAARNAWASDMLKKARDLQKTQDEYRKAQLQELSAKKAKLVTAQRQERANLAATQQARQLDEAKARQERFRSGIKGLWDRLRGEHKRIVEKNLVEGLVAKRRDQQERDRLVIQQRRDIVRNTAKAHETHQTISRSLALDRATFRAAARGVEFKKPVIPDKPKPTPAPPVRRAKSVPSKSVSKDWSDAVKPAKTELSDREQRREAFKAQRREEATHQNVRRDPTLDR